MKKKMLVAYIFMLSDAWDKLHSGQKSFSDSNILLRNDLFLKNYVTSEGVVSHNVLYYQQLSIAYSQISFYVTYFE